MISVQEAYLKIKSEINVLGTTKIKVEDALNCVITEDLISPIHMPPFDQSAMDGYAVNGLNLDSYELIGEIQAGDSGEGIELKKGQAIRIFTGAIVPKSTSSVAKQEIAIQKGTTIRLTEPIKEGGNIRRAGEQIKKGNTIIEKNTSLNLGAIGYLYMLGIDKINVVKKPKVTIIVTGNELVKPGNELPTGKIYESNSYTLKAALKSIGVESEITSVKDDFESTKRIISEALDSSELVITSGGISVGDYDFVGKAMNELGVKEVFYKLKQKPGKPLYFGTKDHTAVFALPGNPAAVLSCFYMYVLPAIGMMQGKQNPKLEQRSLKLNSDHKKGASLTHFLKGFAFGDEVRVLNAQSSAMLSSFAEANCIIQLEEGQEEWKAGELVRCWMIG